jgi:beta-lactam-binding protein with PASTA domain
MLGIGGKFASSKGMVAVPNLSGLTRQQAKDTLAASGLRFSGETEIANNSGSSSNGTATNQSVAAGTLIDYESSISFQYFGTYVPPAPPVTLVSSQSTVEVSCIACGVYAGLTYFNFCNGSNCQTDKYRTYTDTLSNTPGTIYFYSDGTSQFVASGPSYQTTTSYTGTLAQSTTGGRCTSNSQC